MFIRVENGLQELCQEIKKNEKRVMQPLPQEVLLNKCNKVLGINKTNLNEISEILTETFDYLGRMLGDGVALLELQTQFVKVGLSFVHYFDFVRDTKNETRYVVVLNKSMVTSQGANKEQSVGKQNFIKMFMQQNDLKWNKPFEIVFNDIPVTCTFTSNYDFVTSSLYSQNIEKDCLLALLSGTIKPITFAKVDNSMVGKTIEVSQDNKTWVTAIFQGMFKNVYMCGANENSLVAYKFARMKK